MACASAGSNHSSENLVQPPAATAVPLASLFPTPITRWHSRTRAHAPTQAHTHTHLCPSARISALWPLCLCLLLARARTRFTTKDVQRSYPHWRTTTSRGQLVPAYSLPQHASLLRHTSAWHASQPCSVQDISTWHATGNIRFHAPVRHRCCVQLLSGLTGSFLGSPFFQAPHGTRRYQ